MKKFKSGLDEYLKDKALGREGGCDSFPEQREFYEKIFSENKFQNVMEIGFNAGHSAECFLVYAPMCNVYSFDLGDHSSVQVGADYLSRTFPGRHQLILGDSKKTISEFAETNKLKFDFILIDGDHSYEGAAADIKNCRQLAHEETILVMDDMVRNHRFRAWWNKPVRHAWKTARRSGLVTQLGQVDAELVQYNRRGRRPWKHGFSWGKYIFEK